MLSLIDFDLIETEDVKTTHMMMLECYIDISLTHRKVIDFNPRTNKAATISLSFYN